MVDGSLLKGYLPLFLRPIWATVPARGGTLGEEDKPSIESPGNGGRHEFCEGKNDLMTHSVLGLLVPLGIDEWKP
jgi:hypothetical protein